MLPQIFRIKDPFKTATRGGGCGINESGVHVVLRACAVRGASLVVLAAACAGTAFADNPPQTRVTIRGSGNSISIERSETAARRPPSKREQPKGPIQEAIHLKAGGADDASLLAYLRTHQADLPPVVEAEDARRLRKAGAGRAVFAYLATVSAVEIGETGEGREPEASPEAAASYDYETPAYDANYGYPYYGYAPPYAAGLRHGFQPRRMIAPRRQRGFPAPLGHRGMAGRRRPFAE